MSNLSEGTIEMWIKPDSWGAFSAVFCGSNGLPGANGDWLLLGTHSSAGSGPIGLGFFGSAWVWSNSQEIPETNKWLHVAGTWGTEGMKVYLNGILYASNATTWSSPIYSQELIAVSSWSEFYEGMIDELRIWNIARSEQEIKNTMKDTLNALYYETADSGLIAYYRFDEITEFDTGDPIIDVFEDLSVNANHAQVFDSVQVADSDAFSSLDPTLFAINDTVYVTPGDTININVTANDYHANGDSFTIDSYDDSKTIGSVTLNDSIFRYIAPQVSNVDSFSYTIKDGTHNEATANVYIRISPGLASDEWTVALYNFEDNYGNFIRDVSGNNLHALNDSTILETGPWGNLCNFSGNALIEMEVVRQALQEAPEWSIEFLGRSLDSTSTPGFINHSNGNGWVLLPSGSSIAYGVKTTATNNLWISGSWQSLSAGPGDTSWHYYAMSYKESDSLRIYKDGKFLGGYGVTGQFKLSSSTNFKAYIGYNDYGDSYQNGLIDEVRVSNIMRTGTDIEKTAKALNLYPVINAVANDDHLNPYNFTLQQNYPNPFNPITNFKFQISNSTHVNLSIYNLIGQKVATLLDQKQAAGDYQVEWDATGFSSGIYLYKLETSAGFSQTRKLLLLK